MSNLLAGRLSKSMNVLATAFATTVLLTASAVRAEFAPSHLKYVGRDQFVVTPGEGVRVNSLSFYTHKDGLALKSYHKLQSRSDTTDIAYERFSDDNGRTWTDPTPIATQHTTLRGVRRSYPRLGFVDPQTDVLIEFWLEGTLPGDDPLEGMKFWSLRYRLSRDGGRTVYHDGPVFQKGAEFSAEHPFPGVQIGHNSIMIGDQTCATIRLANGQLLQPVQITPLGPDGEYHNPGGGYTYHDAAVLSGRWNDDGQIDWTISERVVGDPDRSTRGMLEPTVAQLPDGRVLMVLRGSNDAKPQLPGYKWFAISRDNGRTWSTPRPWTYSDGENFFSPSSCSQLLKHSNGHIYWVGNISPANPRGNLPRYPLIIGEVDPQSCGLIRKTMCEVDSRREGDWERMQVSNFFAREDRETGDIVIHCSPFDRTRAPGAEGQPGNVNWTSDAWLYRIQVTAE